MNLGKLFFVLDNSLNRFFRLESEKLGFSFRFVFLISVVSLEDFCYIIVIILRFLVEYDFDFMLEGLDF